MAQGADIGKGRGAPRHALTPYVSNHAITRYVQRVLGHPAYADEADVGSKFCAAIHLWAAGMTYDEAVARIMTPTALAAIRMGANSVGNGHCWLKIQNNAVCTVYADRRSTPPGRFKVTSRRETHRRGQSRDRRLKRAPA